MLYAHRWVLHTNNKTHTHARTHARTHTHTHTLDIKGATPRRVADTKLVHAHPHHSTRQHTVRKKYGATHA